MTRVLVDTDVASFHIKGDSRFSQYAAELDGKQLVLSFQSLSELLYWQELHNWGEKRRKEVANLIRQRYIVYPYDELLCHRWSSVRVQAQRIGRIIHPADAWIASTALQLSIPLATHNARDFNFLTGLQLINFPAN